ncbi:MAG TPA: carboxymuconolactone decarboxylase family protein [Candidatus Limnocylindrales bacterium]
MSGSHPRLRLRQLHPEPYQALNSWHASVQKSCADADLPQLLLGLVWIRVSQLNGCAFCLDMHHREARDHGERQVRLDVLPAWRESGDLFTAQERAALGLAEAMTLLPANGVPDGIYRTAAEAFSDQQVGALIMSISVINAYNRIGVATASRPRA